MQTLSQIKAAIDDHIQAYSLPRSPQNLYEPVGYILAQGGKRIRPLLCACGYLTSRTTLESRVLDACLALEVFHNFSLVHDDIMDEAPIRRGEPTVHKRWNIATGILSGDVMLIDVYRLLRQSALPDQLEPVLDKFHKVAIGVCEGQQLDMDFEMNLDVSREAYLDMIYGKTAILLSGCLEIGGLLGGASEVVIEKLGRLGLCLGLGFQLHDDWLDTFGIPKETGKQPGGDILRNKKTAPLCICHGIGSTDDKAALMQWFSDSDGKNNKAKIEAVQEIFQRSGAAHAVADAASAYNREAGELLGSLPLIGPGATYLNELLKSLSGRTT
jgi:geranylgeranyl diphosphate synthase type II